jgi:hypothetical protein
MLGTINVHPMHLRGIGARSICTMVSFDRIRDTFSRNVDSLRYRTHISSVFWIMYILFQILPKSHIVVVVVVVVVRRDSSICMFQSFSKSRSLFSGSSLWIHVNILYFGLLYSYPTFRIRFVWYHHDDRSWKIDPV